MKIPKYKQLESEIVEKSKELEELKNLLKQTCPHNIIIENGYCNDDWAYNKKYTTSYKCSFCGLYASHNEESKEPESELYKTLEKKCQDKKWKNFKKHS